MGSDKTVAGSADPLFTPDDWDDVSDNPELTDAQLAQGHPLATSRPALIEAMRRRRGEQRTPTKALFSLRIDREVLDAYRASGPGWQGRMNAILRTAVGLGPSDPSR